MKRIGFDSEMYMRKQSEQILERISKFDKLYLEFGGKLFDDLHAARVLPGFDVDDAVAFRKDNRASGRAHTREIVPVAALDYAAAREEHQLSHGC